MNNVNKRLFISLQLALIGLVCALAYKHTGDGSMLVASWAMLIMAGGFLLVESAK